MSEHGLTEADRQRRGGDKPEVIGSQLTPAPIPPEKPTSVVGSLIEFSSEAQVDPNETVAFEQSPVHCICPHCERAVITFTDHEASWVTWLLGFVVWFSLGWLAFWVLPLLWPAFKDIVHHCPRCLNVIGRKPRVSLPTFRSEIMSFKIGSCAVVLARKYVFILVGLIGAIATVYILRNTVHLSTHEMPRGQDSSLTWDDFIYDCGPRTSLRHRASIQHAFEERYRRRLFTWQGEVHQIREGFDAFFLRTKSVVLVRMYPPRYTRGELPDVALLFGEDRNSEVADLFPGDWVEFEATMTARGHRGDPEVMLLWHVKKVPKPMPPSSSAGRKSGNGTASSQRGKDKGLTSQTATTPPRVSETKSSGQKEQAQSDTLAAAEIVAAVNSTNSTLQGLASPAKAA